MLSKFTGAAQQLTTALQVNPYAVDRSADTLADALHMPEEEQSDRMRAMRTVVAGFNTYWWAQRMLADAAAIRRLPRLWVSTDAEVTESASA